MDKSFKLALAHCQCNVTMMHFVLLEKDRKLLTQVLHPWDPIKKRCRKNGNGHEKNGNGQLSNYSL